MPIKLKFFARERTSSRVLFWKKRSVNKHNRANIRIFAGKKTYPHARRQQFIPIQPGNNDYPNQKYEAETEQTKMNSPLAITEKNRYYDII